MWILLNPSFYKWENTKAQGNHVMCPRSRCCLKCLAAACTQLFWIPSRHFIVPLSWIDPLWLCALSSIRKPQKTPFMKSSQWREVTGGVFAFFTVTLVSEGHLLVGRRSSITTAPACLFSGVPLPLEKQTEHQAGSRMLEVVEYTQNEICNGCSG